MDPDLLGTWESNKPEQTVNVSTSESSSQTPRDGNAGWWVVVLTNTKRGIKQYDVRVKEDTGSPVNWIHPNVIKQCKLGSSVEAIPSRSFISMTGEKMKIQRRVRITWYGRERKTYEEEFLIFPGKAPFDMILGDEFVAKHGRVRDICADSPKTADPRIFVAQKPTEEQELQMQANELEHRKQSAQLIQQSQGQHTEDSYGLEGMSDDEASEIASRSPVTQYVETSSDIESNVSSSGENATPREHPDELNQIIDDEFDPQSKEDNSSDAIRQDQSDSSLSQLTLDDDPAEIEQQRGDSGYETRGPPAMGGSDASQDETAATSLPSVDPIPGSDNGRKIQFVNPSHGATGHRSESFDEMPDTESDNSSTSSNSDASDQDIASTVPTEPMIEADNESDVLNLFVSLVYRSDAVVQALDHMVTPGHTRKRNLIIETRVRAAFKSFVELLMLETPQQHKAVLSIFFGRSRQITSLIIEAALKRREADDSSDDISDGSDDDNTAATENQILDPDDDNPEDRRPEEDVDIELFQRLLLESTAFVEFLKSIYDVAFPDFTTSLRTTFQSLDVRNRYPRMQDLFSEMAYAQPTEIIATTHSPSRLDETKNFIESVTGAWCWWPFSSPLKPLGPREVRITWTCRCGKVRNENVPRRIARSLVSLVKSTPSANNIPARPSSSTGLGGQPSSSSTVAPASSGGTSTPPLTSPILSIPPNQSTAGPVTTLTQRTHTVFFMTEKGAMHPKFQGLGQSQITTEGKCNHRFFADIRDGYWKCRGWMRKTFSIYQFDNCEFYRFHEYATSKYTMGAKEEVPDLQVRPPEYYYEKANWERQVSQHEFKDRFWNCSPCCECDDHSTVDRIPQKIDQVAAANAMIFYGIIAREKKQIYVAAIYLAILGVSIIPSVWFFFYWLKPENITDDALLSNRMGNLSNAVVPLSMCITLLACILGTFIAI